MLSAYYKLDTRLGLQDIADNKGNVLSIFMEFSLPRKANIKHISLKWGIKILISAIKENAEFWEHVI